MHFCFDLADLQRLQGYKVDAMVFGKDSPLPPKADITIVVFYVKHIGNSELNACQSPDMLGFNIVIV